MKVSVVLAPLAAAAILLARPAAAQDSLPSWLRDRGPGMATSMFGTYVRRGELLVYPFVEGYIDHNYEYKPSELGYGLNVDHRGRYTATEGLLFMSYGLSDNVAIEFEAAVISATVRRAPNDTSAMPAQVTEEGLGDVEGQIRWRFQTETARRPELFSYFETVLPLQRTRRLIGTPDWEFKLGFGLTRGYGWGTFTARLGVEYTREERKFEAGEYAFEYLRRLSPAFRIVGMIEGNQLDEVTLITEVQWHLSSRLFLKVNNGWGLTPNATDFAPEVGLMFSF